MCNFGGLTAEIFDIVIIYCKQIVSSSRFVAKLAEPGSCPRFHNHGGPALLVEGVFTGMETDGIVEALFGA